MFKRLRRLRISLAAKCQLLFGAAVVLIIAAALAVPWHRFEELTDQLNGGPADALAHQTLLQHIAARRAGDVDLDPVPRPTTQHAESQAGAEEPPVPESPRLIGIDTDPLAPQLTAFERKALIHFKAQPDSP